jgi:hypothetical protein
MTRFKAFRIRNSMLFSIMVANMIGVSVVLFLSNRPLWMPEPQFTALSDRISAIPPKEVVKIINGYFREMEEAIRDHEGLVSQYIGDEIEAVFGAPISIENHALRALEAALERKTGASGNLLRRLKGLLFFKTALPDFSSPRLQSLQDQAVHLKQVLSGGWRQTGGPHSRNLL